jgi:preprotein translocase subunit SecE
MLYACTSVLWYVLIAAVVLWLLSFLLRAGGETSRWYYC